MPCRPASALLVGLLVLVVDPAPLLAANPHLARGIRLLDRAEDERALAAFQQALRFKRSTPDEITRVHLYLGMTLFNLIRQADAARHFRQAFQRNPELKLPADIPPKTVEFAEKIRAELKPAPTPPTPEPVTQPVTQEPVPPLIPPAPARPRRRVNWPAWTLGALAVAAGGTGLALALTARGKAEDANDLKVPLAEAQSTHDSASAMALTANILFGVAGAAAITSGVLFLVLREKPGQTRASMVPIPGGALLQVHGVVW